MFNKEVNKLIAEKVMGWEWVKNEWHLPETIPFVWKTDDGIRSGFNPTNDMEDAWKIVDKLKQEDQYYFKLENGGDYDYECSFSDYFTKETFTVEDNLPAMAICKAALKVKGIII